MLMKSLSLRTLLWVNTSNYREFNFLVSWKLKALRSIMLPLRSNLKVIVFSSWDRMTQFFITMTFTGLRPCIRIS